tara:strand:+ start:509 stop:1174 length:666 start_codon:yes stop_codon:yes gene_type:complete
MIIYSLIPARKGSKRIKNKNLLKFNKKHLVNITTESSINTKLINKTFVSTNDKKIIKVLDNSVDIINRPENISTDKSTTEEAIVHFIKFLREKQIKLPNIIVLLQCTSPLRENNDIKLAIEKFLKGKYDSLFSGCKNKNLFWTKKNKKLIPLNYMPSKRQREQKMKNQYLENGSIYVFKTSGFIKKKCRLFGKIGVYIMKKQNSLQIDDSEDIEMIKKYYD